MNQLTAVIPTLSNKTGLAHLLAELKTANVAAVVIDNSKKNLGFAPAVNKGVTQVRSEWVLIANDDIELFGHSGSGQNSSGSLPEWKLRHMLETAKKNNWSAVSPILRAPNGTIENIGYRILPIGKAELNFDENINSDQNLDGLTMASLLIKKEIYDELGGLDESFIAYLEDVDFFLRLKKAGYHFGVDTKVEIIHHHMSTSKKMKGFKEKRDFLNWIKVIRKNWDRETVRKYAGPILVERLKNLWGWVKSLA